KIRAKPRRFEQPWAPPRGEKKEAHDAESSPKWFRTLSPKVLQQTFRRCHHPLSPRFQSSAFQFQSSNEPSFKAPNRTLRLDTPFFYYGIKTGNLYHLNTCQALQQQGSRRFTA